MAEPTEIRKKRERSKYPLHWIVIPVMVLGAAGAGAWYKSRLARGNPDLELPGYIGSLPEIRQEYERYYHKPLDIPAVDAAFQQAGEAVGRHEFQRAAALLEPLPKLAELPSFYNNLGVLYAASGDRSRTAEAFQQALARDPEYPATRKNLERLKDFVSESEIRSRAVRREIEPNDTAAQANTMAVGTPVDGEIAVGRDDTDYYKLVAPSGPRDIFRIEVSSRALSLLPELTLFDANEAPIGTASAAPNPGTPLKREIVLAPGATLFLKVSGAAHTAGAYVLKVEAARAYDSFEPNDEIVTAHRINLGDTVEANIMDPEDTDFYSFLSPRTGKVSIDIENRSRSLIPALTLFSPDMRNNGFGPDVRKPGAGLHHSMAVQENQVYFLQVWSQGHSSGNYSLTVK